MSTVNVELERVRKRHRGILRPADVVAFAEDASTALHARFTWDDAVAAHERRLEQARHIIRCSVVVLRDDQPPIRAYVSLQDDRGEDSYRSLIDVVSDKGMRATLLAQALAEADSWRARYERFAELRPIRDAIARVSKKAKAKTKAKKRKQKA